MMIFGLLLLLLAVCIVYVFINRICGIPLKRSILAIVIYILFAIIINLVPQDWYNTLYFILGVIMGALLYRNWTWSDEKN